jgi:hypothetical protein
VGGKESDILSGGIGQVPKAICPLPTIRGEYWFGWKFRNISSDMCALDAVCADEWEKEECESGRDGGCREKAGEVKDVGGTEPLEYTDTTRERENGVTKIILKREGERDTNPNRPSRSRRSHSGQQTLRGRRLSSGDFWAAGSSRLFPFAAVASGSAGSVAG